MRIFCEKRTWLLTLVAYMTIPSWANAQYDHCVSVYQVATRNLQVSEASYSSINTIYDEYCEASGELKKGDASVGIEAVIYSVPVKFAGSTGSSLERMKNFCRNYSSVRYDTAASRASADIVVVDALKAFNDCVAVTNRGVVVVHSAPTGLDSTFSFQFGSNLSYELQGVQMGRNIACSLQEPESKSLIDLDKSTALTFTKHFSAFCNRAPDSSQDNGRKYYPRTSVTFASNHGSYSVVYPAEEVEDIEFASMLDGRISRVEARLTEVAATVTENHKEVVESIAREKENLSGAINGLRDKLSVKVLKIMRGEDAGRGEPHWTAIGCGDANEYAKSQCPEQSITLTRVYRATSGKGKCGYNYFVATCLAK